MSTLRITLRAGERIFVNGAVLRVDRKTQLEFMNDVTFLLESHVMQATEATTPLRQLYFVVQLMLIDPAGATDARRVFDRTLPGLLAAFSSIEVRSGLQDVADLLDRDRPFEALKRVRALLPLEDAILAQGRDAAAAAAHPRAEPLALPFALAAGAR